MQRRDGSRAERHEPDFGLEASRWTDALFASRVGFTPWERHATATRASTFDFFLDIGCFQDMNPEQQLAEGRGVTALANPGATLLVLAFQPTRIRTTTGAASRTDVETAFPDWEMLSVDPATTAGLGWPLTRTAPQWFRLRRLPQCDPEVAGD